MYGCSDADKCANISNGERKTYNLTERYVEILHAIKAEPKEKENDPALSKDLRSSETSIALPETKRWDLICEAPDQKSSRVGRPSKTGGGDEYDLIGVGAHCDISQPGDTLRSPPPKKGISS